MKQRLSASRYPVPSMLLASLLCASSLPVLTAVAQTTTQGQAAGEAHQQRVYDIPAGSLADTLNRFALASGVSFTFDPQEIANQQSAGLKGNYSLDEGFGILLRGTGLEARYHAASGSYRLEKAAPKVILPTVRVESTTEGTGSYTTGLTNTATRLDMSIRETPQSVTVITRQRIEDQGMDEISEALDQTVGLVLSKSGPTGSDNNIIYSRGFPLENYQVDGVARSTRFGFQNDIADMAIFDRVEVVRGASGLLNGVGQPSGAVNLVRKLPTTEFQAYVSGKYGSWNHQRLEGDVSGPLTESGNLRGRLVAVWQDNELEMDRLALQKDILYGVIETNIAESTLLSFGIEYQHHESTGGDRFGAPIFYPDGTRTHFTASTNLTPDWGYHTRENLSVFSTLEHYFDNGWRVKLDLEKSKREYDSVMPTTALADGDWFLEDVVAANRWGGKPEQDSVNLHAVGTYHLFGRQHDLVLGGSYLRLEEDGLNYNYSEEPIDDLDALIKTGKFKKLDVSPSGGGWATYEEQSGAYMATRLKPTDSVSVILGSRLSNWETRSDSTSAGGGVTRGTTSRESSVVTPYAGIVLDFTDYLSLYASYTDIFNPATVYDANGDLLEPAEGSNLEGGAKLAFFDDKLNILATYYKTQQDNVPEYVPGPGGSVNYGPTGRYVYQGIDGTETTGYELEISGQLSGSWQVGGGYSDNDPRDAKGKPRLTHVAQKTFKFFTQYRAHEWLDGLSIGGNLRWLDGTISDWTGFTQGSVTVVDVMARYEFNSQLSATLNINNLFDKTYFTSIRNEGWFGESRSVFLNLKYSF
ncbi:TonB-dependent siderophore receptor [Cellvibrio japonicus]|uniref:TonB-dependent receptor protein n=2 Tax=Cellvibrio japonicus TaxID=155077 RepID=B3PJT2_CELJU|nr:TonB-dependent receptor [Cellvibrio japonicus]ACE82745.1 TonB-dependent receptor protein [Cellvibrio japonicus Ueda107]